MAEYMHGGYANHELGHRLGRNVAKLRKAMAWTQEELAHRIGVEPETISRLERGATVPSLKSLEKLAVIFGTRISDLLDEQSPEACSEAMQIHAWIVALTDSDKQFVLDSMKQLCSHLAKHN